MRRGEHLRRTINRSTRTAALLATAVALPVVLVVAFLIGETEGGSASAGSSPSASAPPGPLATTVPAPAADLVQQCQPVLAAMPVTLDDGNGSVLRPLVVTPGGPTFLAWGNPLVTLQCGVDRPSWLRDDVDYGQPQQVTAPDGYGATWVSEPSGPRDGRETWTVIDRAVYIRVTLPTGDAPYLTDLSSAIGKTLPPVCTTPQPGDGPDAQYCGSRP